MYPNTGFNSFVYAYHNDYTNKQIGEDEVTQEDEDNSEPLAVRPFVKIFLNLSPAIHLNKSDWVNYWTAKIFKIKKEMIKGTTGRVFLSSWGNGWNLGKGFLNN